MRFGGTERTFEVPRLAPGKRRKHAVLAHAHPRREVARAEIGGDGADRLPRRRHASHVGALLCEHAGEECHALLTLALCARGQGPTRVALEPPLNRAPSRAVEALGAKCGADALEDFAAGLVRNRHDVFSRWVLA